MQFSTGSWCRICDTEELPVQNLTAPNRTHLVQKLQTYRLWTTLIGLGPKNIMDSWFTNDYLSYRDDNAEEDET